MRKSLDIPQHGRYYSPAEIKGFSEWDTDKFLFVEIDKTDLAQEDRVLCLSKSNIGYEGKPFWDFDDEDLGRFFR